MLNAGKPPVHILLDLSAIDHVNLSPFQVREIIPDFEQKPGFYVIIAKVSIVRLFASIGMQAMRIKYQFVQNREEVIQFLIDHDVTLAG